MGCTQIYTNAMLLQQFRVQNFRCFEDSGAVPVGAGVLPIVGKNEAGKSALLQALSQVSQTKTNFTGIRDWPKSRRLSDQDRSSPVVTAWFELDDDEKEWLTETDSSLHDLKQFGLTRTYSGGRTLELGVTVPAIDHRLIALARQLEVPRDGNEGLAEARTTLLNPFLPIEARVRAFRTLRGSELLTEELRTALSAFESEIEAVERRQIATDGLVTRVPEFHYFNSYDFIDGELNLDRYLEHLKEGTRTQGETLFALAAELAGLDLEHLQALDNADTAEAQERNQLVREASLAMSRAFGRIWRQRSEITTEFRLDGPTLRIEVGDSIQQQPVPLDDRSTGFRWFYSFYILFEAQASGLFKDAILLLDEPGLSLHGRAQADLVELMAELGMRNQILYTTHSPFMLDPDHLDRVRVVEDSVGGSRVADSLWAVDPDNSFPVQYALGFDVARTHFGLVDQLVVEGVSDYHLIEGIRALVVADGGDDPLQSVAIVPAGGAAKVAAVVTVSLGQGHKVRVLLDDDPEGRRQKDYLIRERLMSDKSICLIPVTGAKECAIEDLIGSDIYKAVVKETYSADIGERRFIVPGTGHPQIARRTEEALERLGISLNKIRVARNLAERARIGALPKRPSSADLKRYREFLEKIALLRAASRS